ncbi:Serine acetyltransferase [Candidatus Hodgkinia cicadicola]|nr:Serine acetyltransferase [Candidatus Hodgkinia cicadicola]
MFLLNCFILSKLCVELAALDNVSNLLFLQDFRLVVIKLFSDQFIEGAGAVVSALLGVWDNFKFWETITTDLLTVYYKDLASASVFDGFAANGLRALFLYRLAVCTSDALLKWYLTHLMSLVCGCEISTDASIGNFVLLDHANGVVLGQQATVGDNVVIMHDVTLGASGNKVGLVKRHPTVCSGVYLGASAKLLGDIVVGHCGCVSANTVLTRDLLPYNTAVNLPARVLI